MAQNKTNAEVGSRSESTEKKVSVKLNPALTIRGYTFADGFHVGGEEVKAVSAKKYEEYVKEKVAGSQVVVKA